MTAQVLAMPGDGGGDGGTGGPGGLGGGDGALTPHVEKMVVIDLWGSSFSFVRLHFPVIE